MEPAGVRRLMFESAGGGGTKGEEGIFSKERPEGWLIKFARFHLPNVVICKLVVSYILTPVIGEYILTSTLDYLPYLEEAINHFP